MKKREAAQSQLELQRSELEQAKQLQAEIQHELDVIRAELARSNQSIESKQQSINDLHSEAANRRLFSLQVCCRFSNYGILARYLAGPCGGSAEVIK